VAAWYRVELEVTPDQRHCPAAQTDIPMISKSVVFLFSAIALGGCCISGNGCYAPVAGAPIAWDGLGSPPTDVTEVSEDQPKKKTRPRREIIVGPLGDVAAAPNSRSQAGESWAQQEAADQADEIRLKNKLRICSNCMAAPAREDAIDGMARR